MIYTTLKYIEKNRCHTMDSCSESIYFYYLSGFENNGSYQNRNAIAIFVVVCFYQCYHHYLYIIHRAPSARLQHSWEPHCAGWWVEELCASFRPHFLLNSRFFNKMTTHFRTHNLTMPCSKLILINSLWSNIITR